MLPSEHTHHEGGLSSSSSGDSAGREMRSRRLPRIDMHTHILPPELPDFGKKFGYGEWVSLRKMEAEQGSQSLSCGCKAKMYKGDAFFREVEGNCFDAETRIQDCDRDGVTVQVLSTVPVMFAYDAKPEDCLEVAVFLNDHIASVCKEHPTRFVGLGTVPMQSTELAIQEMTRCVTELGLAGVQIGTHVNSKPLGDPSLFPFFEACERVGAAVFVHPWYMVGEELMKKYWLPWLVGMPAETSFAICSMIFSGVFEKLPRLRVCFAHGGGNFPGTVGRVQKGFTCRPDLYPDNQDSPLEHLGRFWCDSLTHDSRALVTLAETVGIDRVCLGSDYPFPLGEVFPAASGGPGTLVCSMGTLGWGERAKMKVLWSNGLKFLGLEDKEEMFLRDRGVQREAIREVEEEEDGSVLHLSLQQEKVPGGRSDKRGGTHWTVADSEDLCCLDVVSYWRV
uniref:2-amino-3-carboxymuconate-6-semialdehyde decarboxylase n=1 Tax=Chromera velia CCMP2878 TaxID=1169474 RepID=A0A0G4H7D0_9ALVE|mmetsp:Transcript_9866/g.19129  ORF Transcript_9866/g.19129 Transcript_9866/m.19129 type:complete len:450 (+) Transcript_9866:230-1579(+)|eukprot:Cvel_24932.t1-p1 / transcript=Cvel_24932.t1 / gene=Cvel_24932 / organism=Chromera_velia_CCMP2878 / gene_product=2-amino-3-carboxymuconate-6-semialdehyde, putative / transcript_product=2-amino-3-carboxymuconate-6-semialdehyde, putative / location=Cvel_scaffold2758:11099-13838(+) / protein_length=449 / sequence_SO=supercontig / SO=protein_coding / is_pseudo=false